MLQVGPGQLAVSLMIWRAAADVSVDPWTWCLHVSSCSTHIDLRLLLVCVILHLVTAEQTTHMLVLPLPGQGTSGCKSSA